MSERAIPRGKVLLRPARACIRFHKYFIGSSFDFIAPHDRMTRRIRRRLLPPRATRAAQITVDLSPSSIFVVATRLVGGTRNFLSPPPASLPPPREHRCLGGLESSFSQVFSPRLSAAIDSSRGTRHLIRVIFSSSVCPMQTPRSNWRRFQTLPPWIAAQIRGSRLSFLAENTSRRSKNVPYRANVPRLPRALASARGKRIFQSCNNKPTQRRTVSFVSLGARARARGRVHPPRRLVLAFN